LLYNLTISLTIDGQLPFKVRRIVVENKNIGVVFGVTVIAFLAVTFLLVKDFNTKRVDDLKEYKATITAMVIQKNNKIKMLSNRLAADQKMIDDLRSTLADTRNQLEALSKKLVTPPAPAPVAASEPVPAAAAPAPAAVVPVPAVAAPAPAAVVSAPASK
jgi:hypothetical protein